VGAYLVSVRLPDLYITQFASGEVGMLFSFQFTSWYSTQMQAHWNALLRSSPEGYCMQCHVTIHVQHVTSHVITSA